MRTHILSLISVLNSRATQIADADVPFRCWNQGTILATRNYVFVSCNATPKEKAMVDFIWNEDERKPMLHATVEKYFNEWLLNML